LRSSSGQLFHYEQLTGSPYNQKEEDIVFILIKQKKVRELELFINDCPYLDLTRMFDTEDGYTPLMKAAYAGEESLLITRLLCSKVAQMPDGQELLANWINLKHFDLPERKSMGFTVMHFTTF
jgi:hypothetical protein